MKLSKYNIRIQLSEKSDLIYNSFSNKFIAIKHEISLANVNGLNIHFRDLLYSNGMIISDDINEYESVVREWKTNTEKKDSYLVIINPTLKCNFNCWYCYENHSNASVMNEQLFNKTKMFIHNILKTYDKLTVSFFGGEPLLEYVRIVKPLILYAELEATKLNKTVDFSFTTNGFLLDREMISFLHQHHLRAMQITLDGGRKTHNKTRVSKSKDSFETILGNVLCLIENKVYVTLRINVTPNNIDECWEIIEWLNVLSDEVKEYLVVNIQKVWQTQVSEEIINKIDCLLDAICAKGVYGCVALRDNMRDMCYADKDNTVVINSNGNIFKCTAIDFDHHVPDGYISENGELVEVGNRISDRNKKRFENQECCECDIFPLCLGGCSKTVDSSPKNYCIYQHNKKAKQQVVMDIIKDRIRRDAMLKNKLVNNESI